MSDILSRLIARAQDSPTSLTRRVRYRFAPVNEPAEAWPGHEGGAPLTDAFGTQADVRAEAPEVRPGVYRGDAPHASRPIETTDAAGSDPLEGTHRLARHSGHDTDVGRSPPVVAGKIAGQETAIAADAGEERIAPTAAPPVPAARHEDRTPATASEQGTARERDSSVRTSREPGATSAMPEHTPSRGLVDHQARPAVAKRMKTSPERTGLTPVAQLRAAPTSADASLAPASSPRSRSAIAEAEARHTLRHEASRARPVAPIEHRRNESATQPPLEAATTTESPLDRAPRGAGQGSAFGAKAAGDPIRPSPAGTEGMRAEGRRVAKVDTPVTETSPGKVAPRSRRSGRAEHRSATSPERQHGPRRIAAPEPVPPPDDAVEPALRRKPSRRSNPAEDIIAASVTQRREVAVPKHPPSRATASPAAASQYESRAQQPVSAPSNRVNPSALPKVQDPTPSPATRPLPSGAIERPLPSRQIVSGRTADRPAPARRIFEHPQSDRDHAAGQSLPRPEHAVSQTSPSRAVALRPTAAPAAPMPTPTPTPTNDIHIDIGRIQIELPRAKARRARAEPPPLQGKPRGGPDG